MEKESADRKYTKKEIEQYVYEIAGKEMNQAAVYKRINRLIRSGAIARVGQGLYCFSDKKQYDYALETPLSRKVLNFLRVSYPNLEFVIYESTILNEFLNHLLAHSITIVEAKKGYSENIFWKLQELGFKGVMLNPTDDERYRYDPSIIVKNMVSKSPIQAKKNKITIEKLAVDIICDNLLNQFYQGAEKAHMIEEIFDKYALKYDSIKNYAKRRSAFDLFLKYVPEEERNHFDD